jgi:hypothetical protein
VAQSYLGRARRHGAGVEKVMKDVVDLVMGLLPFIVRFHSEIPLFVGLCFGSDTNS